MDTSKPTILIQDTRNQIALEEKFKILETFEIYNQYHQLIRISTREFSAVCPGTGLPDIAEVIIEYIPNKRCVELKALKYYFFSFRDDAIFQEPVTDVIFGHLLRALQPHYLKIEITYNIRGGFLTTTEASYGDKSKYLPNQSVVL